MLSSKWLFRTKTKHFLFIIENVHLKFNPHFTPSILYMCIIYSAYLCPFDILFLFIYGLLDCLVQRHEIIWDLMPGWRMEDFPSHRSTCLSHTLTHFSIPVIDWRGCVSIGMVPQCLSLSSCAMKLIVAIEITDSHRNLDIFRGFAMMIRLYLK